MKRTMKKLLALGLAVTTILAMTGCGSTSTATTNTETAETTETADTAETTETAETTNTEDSSDSSTESFTAGFIFVGAKDDYGYNQAAYEASEAVEEYFGDQITVLRSENVPETSEASRVLEQMIQQGATILFPTSYGHLDPALEVAAEDPDTTVFFHQGGLTTSDNLGTYFGTIWQSFYLCGMAAGSCTETNQLGFVASFPIPQVLANINAFTLGAQSVNPDITCTAIFTGSWSDPALQTSAATTLIDAGVDVITQHQDSTKTIVELCESAGIYTVGNHVDASELAPNAWLVGAVWNWDQLYIDMVQTAVDGDFEGSIYDGEYRGGLAEGIVDISQFGEAVPQDVRDAILQAKEDMISGDLYAFQGEIIDQNGTVTCAADMRLTIEEIESMDYLVQGVIGTIE